MTEDIITIYDPKTKRGVFIHKDVADKFKLKDQDTPTTEIYH